MSPVVAARYFGVDIADYRREGSILVIGSGCGLMLSIMDACRKARWCFDADNYRHSKIDWQTLGQFLDQSDITAFGVFGWFTIDRPTNLIALLSEVTKPVVSYGGGCGFLPNETTNLREAIDAMDQIGNVC